MALTKKQKEVYEYIKTYTLQQEVSPTQKEIKDHFGLKSFGSVNKYMKYLQEANLIEIDWNARRGIRVLELEVKAIMAAQNDLYEEIPLLGDVAAGNPIEALENPDSLTSVPKTMINRPGRYYALNVQGDSMIEDGILEGDVLICRYQAQANQGQTVIAIIDNEATVKKFYQKNRIIELHPANERLKPFSIREDQDFRIAGVVVGLLRNYE